MNKAASDIFSIITYLAVIVMIIAFGPLAVLWSLNQLFPVLAIPYTFWNWLAVVLLNATWMSKTVLTKKDD